LVWACRLRPRSSGSVPDLGVACRRRTANNPPPLAMLDSCRLTSTGCAAVRSKCGQIFGHL
jgi:hypothetical protein